MRSLLSQIRLARTKTCTIPAPSHAAALISAGSNTNSFPAPSHAAALGGVGRAGGGGDRATGSVVASAIRPTDRGRKRNQKNAPWLTVSLLMSLPGILTAVAGPLTACQALVERAVSEAQSVPCERVAIRTENGEQTIDVRVLVEAADGGLLLESADARLWMVQPADLVSRQPLPDELAPVTVKELEASLLEGLPAGFRTRTSKHFVVAYNTSPVFARWVSNLYEKLLRGFLEHWEKKRGYKLEAPTTPLAIVVFGSLDEYTEHVRRELGTEPGAMVAYYNLVNNRVALFDLTSVFGPAGGTATDIPSILNSPGAAEMVATIIHEGTHQLMFNTSMQRRFADTPLWVNEGLATWFETPDAASGQGFRAIGQVNPLRLRQFRAYLPQRGPDSLASLLGSDASLRDPAQLANRYGEAWAFCHFLLERHEEAFVNYLRHLAAKPLMVYDGPEQRLADFAQFFPEELSKLDAKFVEWIGRLER